MADLIQKAIEQTERAKYGVCCAEAVHALDIANKRIEELEAENKNLQSDIDAYRESTSELAARNEELEHWFHGYRTPELSMAAMMERIIELKRKYDIALHLAHSWGNYYSVEAVEEEINRTLREDDDE